MLLFHYFSLPTPCFITTISLLGNRDCLPPTHFLLQDMISKAGDCLFFWPAFIATNVGKRLAEFVTKQDHNYLIWNTCNTKLLYTKEQRMLISSNLRQVVECIFSLFTTKEVNSSYSHLTWKQRGITDSRTNPLLTTSSIAALKVHSFGRAPVGQNFSSFPALINWGTYSRGSVSQRIPAMQLRRSLGLMQTSLQLSLVG